MITTSTGILNHRTGTRVRLGEAGSSLARDAVWEMIDDRDIRSARAHKAEHYERERSTYDLNGQWHGGAPPVDPSG